MPGGSPARNSRIFSLDPSASPPAGWHLAHEDHAAGDLGPAVLLQHPARGSPAPSRPRRPRRARHRPAPRSHPRRTFPPGWTSRPGVRTTRRRRLLAARLASRRPAPRTRRSLSGPRARPPPGSRPPSPRPDPLQTYADSLIPDSGSGTDPCALDREAADAPSTSATPGTEPSCGRTYQLLDRPQAAEVQPAPFDRVPEDLARRRRVPARAPAPRPRPTPRPDSSASRSPTPPNRASTGVASLARRSHRSSITLRRSRIHRTERTPASPLRPIVNGYVTWLLDLAQGLRLPHSEKTITGFRDRSAWVQRRTQVAPHPRTRPESKCAPARITAPRWRTEKVIHLTDYGRQAKPH